jgi:hypothetical protein
MTLRPDDAPDPREDHGRLAEERQLEAERLGGIAQRLAMTRLGLFIASGVLSAAGLSQDNTPLASVGGLLLLVFAGVAMLHARVLTRKAEQEAREAVHRRHVARAVLAFHELSPRDVGALPEGHVYAADIDLVGEASLMTRVDCCRTRRGHETLTDWLAAPADTETILARQQAVEELCPRVALREDLEAAGAVAFGKDVLDASPFVEFTERQPWLSKQPFMLGLIHVAPLSVLGTFIAARLGLAPDAIWAGLLTLQCVLVFGTARRANDVFDLVAARRGYVEAFGRMLGVAERASFEAPLLVSLQGRLRVGERPPSSYMARLDRWAGLAEFRTQFPVHFFINLATCWDLHVLWRLESWNEQVGQGIADAFEALGELEALSSLAALGWVDLAATMPELAEPGAPFEAEGLSHPLIAHELRVANDVTLRGSGTALIVTGSNMAGKSTLLRAVGLNIALALAGGPVTARRLRVPQVRLRASMRIDDSLQRGASYFHAEVQKLRAVVEQAGEGAPIFFLLDELFRGTNARARHLGARSVLRHLLERGGSGLVATHDVALADLEEEQPDKVHNVHFTDTMHDGEMVFDYRLRDGVVLTSNALRILALAGIDVPDDDALR